MNLRLHRKRTLIERLLHPVHNLLQYQSTSGVWELLLHPVSMGIGAGFTFGKIIGIVGMSRLMVYLKLAELPNGVNWNHLYGVAMLAGVGFTMSLFISELAFTDDNTIYIAKIGILMTSILAGTLGFFFLRFNSKTELAPVKKQF